MKRLLRILFHLLPPGLRIRLRRRVSLLYHNCGYGDTLLVAAVAREIKRTYGDVHICVNCTRNELLEGNPYVDEAGDRFDGIDLNYHHGKTNVGKHFDQNILDVMCKKVGVRNPNHTVDMFLSEDEMAFGDSVFRKLRGPVVTLHTTPGGFDAGRKRWPCEHWKKLVYLLKKNGVTTVQLGAAGEEPVAGAVHMMGKYSIRQSTSLLAHAHAHVGVVSSMMHAAEAVATPAVILFGGFERYRAHEYARITPIESMIDCSPCGLAETTMQPCKLNNQCMREITPEMVEDAVYITLSLESAPA